MTCLTHFSSTRIHVEVYAISELFVIHWTTLYKHLKTFSRYAIL